MPVAPMSTPDLVDLIRKSGIVPDVPAPDTLPEDAQKAAGVLVQKGVITRFQAQQLMLGRHKGFRIGAYIILEQLGRGGMGVVYLAEHRELRRKVAIKVLVVNRDEDAKLAAERFFREARAVAALDHPNIVRLFDVCRHGDTPYLVMEYVDGETLQHALDRDGAMPYTAAAEAVAQAAAGLQHAHEKGFVHRDIKPGNLMRDRSGVVKILDMGLARSATNTEDKLTERLDAGAVVGTADFIAPEQALNSPNVDVRADIYSLGATFFALVTGKPPFAGNTTQKLLQHQMAAAPSVSQIDASLPKGLAGVVSKMLAKKPQDRFQTPAEIIAALAPWLGNSARVMAGLSRTNLAAGAELHARLQEKAGSTGRLRRPSEDAVSDSGVVDPVDPAAETRAVASSRTGRSDPPVMPAKAVPKWAPEWVRKQPPLHLAAAAVAVVASLAGIAFACGAFDSKPAQEQVQAPPPPPVVPPSDAQQPAPTPKKVDPPKVTPKKVEPVPAVDPPSSYRLDLAAAQPFTLRGRSESSGMRGRDLRFVPSALKTGPGDFPAGWTGETWGDKTGEAEFSVGVHAGRPVLTARNLDKGTAFLLSPDISFRAPAARVRFQYLTKTTTTRAVILKFKVPGMENKTGLVEVGTLAGTNGEWKTFEQTVPLRGHRTVFFELHAAERGDGPSLYLASFEAADAAQSSEPLLARFDVGGQGQFAIRSGLEVRADGSKASKQLSRTGTGEPPAGWSARCYNKDTEMEYFADSAGGVGIRNASGPGSAMLFAPTVAVPTGLCRVRVEYSATTRAGGFNIRFKPSDSRGAWDAYKPEPTGPGAWKTTEFVHDLKGATGGLFEFHNNDSSPTAAVRIKSVVITQPPAGTQPTPIPTTGSAAAPPAPSFVGWTEGPLVYRFDAASIPAFRATKEGGTVTAGDTVSFPRGVSGRCWKKDATGEFRRDEADGSPALGVTNFTDLKSGQYSFELERELGLSLRPGGVYRVKLGYLTRNEAVGSLVVQTAGEYKGVGSARLDNGAGWRTATVTFERKDAAVRVTIDNNSVGEGNVLYFRTVELLELVPPKR